jgi:aromatic ring-cleaving dioxygenase
MTEKTTQSVANLGYHAHIYYDPLTTRTVAERVCAAIEEKFPVEIDGFRDTPIGPHPIANVLVIFKPDQFEHVVPHLMLNRDGLDVLVHGNPVELKLQTLPHGRGGRLPSGVSA